MPQRRSAGAGRLPAARRILRVRDPHDRQGMGELDAFALEGAVNLQQDVLLRIHVQDVVGALEVVDDLEVERPVAVAEEVARSKSTSLRAVTISRIMAGIAVICDSAVP
jgi:hypothetical protein